MTTSFSPLDMLDMQDSEQTILRCLNRLPCQTVEQIAVATDLAIGEVDSALRQMVSRSQLAEQLQHGERVFSVRFSKLQARVRHVPSYLLDLFHQQPESFFEDIALTASLTPEERSALLGIAETRQVMTNEVVVWQGDQFRELGIVRMGLLKKSRLKRGPYRQTVGYVQRSEWYGLSEVLSSYASPDTYTAVAESELLVWRKDDFIDFLRHSPTLTNAISLLFSQQLHQCQNQRIHGAGRLWAIESLEAQAGATTFAANLAYLISRNSSGSRPRVALWNAHDDGSAMLDTLGIDQDAQTHSNNVIEHKSGIDVILSMEQPYYPPQVQLDILLTDLQSRYDYIICDTGHEQESEFLLRLRGLAEPLITLTCQTDPVRATERWNAIQPYSKPAQKRILAFTAMSADAGEIDPRFHLALPYDPGSVAEALRAGKLIMQSAHDSALAKAYDEAYRRLSLNHVIGIFVPSTLDVDQLVDNREQVQTALSFLGSLFGGATSSNADGVWQSEQDGLVAEQVTIVRAFVSRKALEQHLDDVISFAVELKKEMRQEAIALDVDNQLILV